MKDLFARVNAITKRMVALMAERIEETRVATEVLMPLLEPGSWHLTHYICLFSNQAEKVMTMILKVVAMKTVPPAIVMIPEEAKKREVQMPA